MEASQRKHDVNRMELHKCKRKRKEPGRSVREVKKVKSNSAGKKKIEEKLVNNKKMGQSATETDLT